MKISSPKVINWTLKQYGYNCRLKIVLFFRILFFRKHEKHFIIPRKRKLHDLFLKKKNTENFLSKPQASISWNGSFQFCFLLFLGHQTLPNEGSIWWATSIAGPLWPPSPTFKYRGSRIHFSNLANGPVQESRREYIFLCIIS
jgi:hypothetical protein